IIAKQNGRLEILHGMKATLLSNSTSHKLCKGKMPVIFVDGGKWYPWVLQRLGFRYTIMAFGPGCAIERFLSLIDWRIRRFWERFPNKSTLKKLATVDRIICRVYKLLDQGGVK
ncbi:MAG: hypothetical protein ACP5LE_07950, partial [Thermoplasmata archaeon]